MRPITLFKMNKLRISKLRYKQNQVFLLSTKPPLKSAENYAKMMNMSKKGIYEQLISEYGDQFPEEAAQYAMDHLEGIDWNKNALESAKIYREMMPMSNQAIYDQLISEAGDQFTAEEAQFAIDNLPQ